jgi:hypothetical protein
VPLGRGERFPALSLPRTTGGTEGLLERVPRVVILGHRDCKTTRQTLPYVDRMHRRVPGSSVAVLQDDPDVARALAKELDLSLPILLEPSPYKAAEALGLTAVPTLFLVGKDGVIEDVSEGFSRSHLEGFAGALEVPLPLFDPDDPSPAFRPG